MSGNYILTHIMPEADFTVFRFNVVTFSQIIDGPYPEKLGLTWNVTMGRYDQIIREVFPK